MTAYYRGHEVKLKRQKLTHDLCVFSASLGFQQVNETDAQAAWLLDFLKVHCYAIDRSTLDSQIKPWAKTRSDADLRHSE